MISLLQDWVTDQAARRPAANAIVDETNAVQYQELELSSNRLARMLRETGCGKGDRVCFLIPKSQKAIVSILGILKADCIYTPLDFASPPHRLARIVEALEPKVIIICKESVGLAESVVRECSSKLARATFCIVDGVGPSIGGKNRTVGQNEIDGQLSDSLAYENKDEDPAYIFFTSGSTGVPKGVIISHANVQYFIRWAVSYFGIDETGKHSGHIPLHFDLSVFDMFGAFAGGAELFLVPQDCNVFPGKIPEFIRNNGLTQWFSVPSILNYLAKFNAVSEHDFPSLKRILWCGEVFPTPALIYWMKRLPHVTFTNLYGPTETTIASSYHTVPVIPEDDKKQIPIGVACPGEKLLVLGNGLHQCNANEIGDLYIGGVGLSPGYWKDNEKTQEVFCEVPLDGKEPQRLYKTGDLASIGDDGLVYFAGRSDSQIKSRGYRIELGEVEAALSTLVALREAAVVPLHSQGFENTIICCAYVFADKETKKTLVELRKELLKIIPNYMMPTKWKEYVDLPKNQNGKIDRRAIFEDFQKIAPPLDYKE